MEKDSVVLCQALYQAIGEEEWTDMHEQLEEVWRTIGVKKRVRKWLVGLGKLACRNFEREEFF